MQEKHPVSSAYLIVLCSETSRKHYAQQALFFPFPLLIGIFLGLGFEMLCKEIATTSPLGGGGRGGKRGGGSQL